MSLSSGQIYTVVLLSLEVCMYVYIYLFIGKKKKRPGIEGGTLVLICLVDRSEQVVTAVPVKHVGGDSNR